MSDQKFAATKLEALLESAVDAIITIDQNGLIKSINHAAENMFGYEKKEFFNRNISFLMPEPWASKHDDYMKRYQKTGQKKIIGIGREVEGLRKDGTTFPMHLAVSEFIADGEVFYTGILQDITKRKQTEAALLRAQKMEAIGQLTGGIAHDFNNLLTVITGNLELLEMRIKEPAQVELLKEAQEAADLGADLTERLLAFARQTILEPKILDLNELIEKMSNLLSRTLGEHISLKTELDNALAPVRIDPGQVESAILNLAVNARDAMSSGGRLLIETANIIIDEEYVLNEYGLEPGNYVCISVSDTGYGMAHDVHSRAFEPFFTTKQGGRGTGLGLSMVYGFAKQSGGHVTIYSEVGLGTTINVYLPQYCANVGKAEERDDTKIEQIPTGKGEVILVVEDDKRVRDVTIRRLEKLNYQVLTAETGDEAIKILKKNPDIDIVFTDMVMPGETSGYDLAHHIRADYPDIKVLMTSGYAADLLQTEKLAESALNLLRKPYKEADLARIIHMTLS